MSDDWRGYSLPNGYIETMKHIAARMEAAEAKLAAIAEITRSPRPWDEDDADSVDARTARAYNSALAEVFAVLKEGPKK